MLFQQELVHQFQTHMETEAILLMTRERVIYAVALELTYLPQLGQTATDA
jgi:hypothetical protein